MQKDNQQNFAEVDTNSNSDSIKDNEKEDTESLGSYVWTKIAEIINSFVPSDDLQQFHPNYFYPIAVIAILLLLGTFLGSFLPGYFAGISNRYLSPAENADPDYCESVPTTITGTFLGTPDGYWEGDIGFVYSNATYVMEGTNYQTSLKDYTTSLNGIYESLTEFGYYAKLSDLATNLLLWMSLLLTNDGNAAQKFYMFADPVTIFNRNTFTGSVSSVAGDCSVSPISNFDTATGLLELSYDIVDYVKNTVCMEAANPVNLGYSYVANSNVFNIKVDIRTLITALAVNMLVLEPSALQLIASATFPIDYKNETYNVVSYIDPRYPGMQPITCAQINGSTLCMILLAQTYALPVFRHTGKNYNFPEFCDCTTLTVAELSNPYSKCNLFQFLVGLVFYDTTDGNDALELILRLGMANVDGHSFYPMFAASPFGITSTYRSYFDDVDYRRENLYQFCQSSSGRYCHIITFTTYDNTIATHSVSKYFYQLPLGACHDSFTTTEENWKKLIDKPFTTLTQNYEICRDSQQTVFLAQFGNSMGNMSAASPLILLFLLVILFSVQKLFGVNIPKKYSASEKQEVLEQLAITLLIIRDGKVTPNELLTNIKQFKDKISQEEEESADLESGIALIIDAATTVPRRHGTIQSSVLTLAHELALFDSLEYINTYQYNTIQPKSASQPKAASSTAAKETASAVANPSKSVPTRRRSSLFQSNTPKSEVQLNSSNTHEININGVELATFYVDRSRQQIKLQQNPSLPTSETQNARQASGSDDSNIIKVRGEHGLIKDKYTTDINGYVLDEYEQLKHSNTPHVPIKEINYLNIEGASYVPADAPSEPNAILIPTSLTAIRMDDGLFLQLVTWSNYLDNHIAILMEIYGNCPGVPWSIIANSNKYRKIYQTTKTQYESKQFLKDLFLVKLFDKPSLQQFHAVLMQMRNRPGEYRTFQIQYFEDVKSELKKLLKKLMTLLMVHGSVMFGCDIGDVLSMHAHDIGYCIGTSQWELSELEYYVDLLS